MVHESLVEFIKPDSFRTVGRHCGLQLVFGREKTTVISSHLPPENDLAHYRSSLGDLQALVAEAKQDNGSVIVGADAQTRVGAAAFPHLASVVGGARRGGDGAQGP